jgi:2-polyprenyl-6-methoxyphenol hydroxylase-like FAD-dependent oxidoreductase
MIDFFGPGFDAFEKLGLLPELERIHYLIAQVSFADATGRPRTSLPYPVMRKRLFADRHFNFMRGELERLLCDKLQPGTVIHFGASVESIDDSSESVKVRLTNGTLCDCDILVGADGLHSQVRKLMFGSEEQFFRFMGFYTAAYIIDRVLPEAPSNEFRTVTVPDKQVGIYPIRQQRTATFFLHRAERPMKHVSRQTAEAELRRVYGGMQWIVPELLDLMPQAESIYFDSVAQIVMPTWSRGRVVLVGDACWCVSLLAGQGASMAVAGGYVLAEELNRTPTDLAAALARYEARLRPAAEQRQASGRNIARWFVPENQFGIMVRDFFLRTSVWPGLSWFLRRQFSGDKIL